MTKRSRFLANDSDYTPFIILCGARTGSTLLARALDSNPTIRCYGEIFNFVIPFIDYQVEGYDRASEADIALRKEDPVRFLTERIYGRQPDQIAAAGFKFHYRHFWFDDALWREIADDRPIRVIHLKRRNLVRMCVSTRIAEHTGVWQDRVPSRSEQVSTMAKKITPTNAMAAVFNPAKAITALRRSMKVQPLQRKAAREPLMLTAEELEKFFDETNRSTAYFSEVFKDHPTLDLTYEEMTADLKGALASAQDFLGVERRKLTIANRRQNPEPLSELIANYDELRREFANHPYAWMFEE